MSVYVYAQFKIGEIEPPKACMNILKDLFVGHHLDPAIHSAIGVDKNNVFDKDSFIAVYERYEERARSDFAELTRLKGIRQSKDYYTLSEDGKMALTDDIDSAIESFNDHSRRAYVCQHMIDMLNMFEDMFAEERAKCLVEIIVEN